MENASDDDEEREETEEELCRTANCFRFFFFFYCFRGRVASLFWIFSIAVMLAMGAEPVISRDVISKRQEIVERLSCQGYGGSTGHIRERLRGRGGGKKDRPSFAPALGLI